MKSPSNALKKSKICFIYNSITRQNPPAEEDHVIWLKAPEQLQNGPCGEIILLHKEEHKVTFNLTFIVFKHLITFPLVTPKT